MAKLSVSCGSILVLMLAGCAATQPAGVEVHGRVTAGGKPLSGAVITLEPIHPTTGPNASAPVFDGDFSFDASSRLEGGRYRVRIAMLPVEIRAGLPPEQQKKLPSESAVVDPSFDGNSKLECELRQGQKNVLTFDIHFL